MAFTTTTVLWNQTYEFELTIGNDSELRFNADSTAAIPTVPTPLTVKIVIKKPNNYSLYFTCDQYINGGWKEVFYQNSSGNSGTFYFALEDYQSTSRFKCTIISSGVVRAETSEFYLGDASTPLSTPTGLNADQITSNSATISWNAVENATDYKVEYRRQGDTTWNE